MADVIQTQWTGFHSEMATNTSQNETNINSESCSVENVLYILWNIFKKPSSHRDIIENGGLDVLLLYLPECGKVQPVILEALEVITQDNLIAAKLRNEDRFPVLLALLINPNTIDSHILVILSIIKNILVDSINLISDVITCPIITSLCSVIDNRQDVLIIMSTLKILIDLSVFIPSMVAEFYNGLPSNLANIRELQTLQQQLYYIMSNNKRSSTRFAQIKKRPPPLPQIKDTNYSNSSDSICIFSPDPETPDSTTSFSSLCTPLSTRLDCIITTASSFPITPVLHSF